MLRRRGPNLPVLLDQQVADSPRARDRCQGESSRAAEADGISGLVRLGPEVGTVDITDLATDVCHGEHNLRKSTVSTNIREEICRGTKLTAFFSLV